MELYSMGEENNETSPGSGAVTVARSMYPADNTNFGVESTLIYGIQWDTALRFIEAYDVGETGYDTYATNSTGMGNYSGTGEGDPINAEPTTSGFSDTFRQKNIFDMAGNVCEWSMEVRNTYHVHRGARYIDSGSEYPASTRGNINLDYSDPSIGFRVALYIK